MLTVAILGANGFIGSRAVEMLHLEQQAIVRPIVRSLPNLARLSRFDLDCRIADAFDVRALTEALTGCDILLHAIAGDPKTIVDSLTPTYQAAQAAGIKRLIYLSTASVHGQSPAVGTDESSPLNDHQPLAYNNAKVKAEQKLLELRRQSSVEVTFLRPGIVFGPRSFWITSFANQLLTGEAVLYDHGQGICNSVYVDNVIHAATLLMTAAKVDGEAFLIGDREQVTWADLYRPVAEAMGFDLRQLPQITSLPDTSASSSWHDRLETILASKPSLAFLSLFPNRWRQAARAALNTLVAASTEISPWMLPVPVGSSSEPQLSLEMAMLYQCTYKLPYRKATISLDYQPIVSFEIACQRTVSWMKFAGYPCVKPI